SREEEEELAFTFSRGFTPGWLRGDDHQELSHGIYPRHRGVRAGKVERVEPPYRVYLRLDEGAPALKAGDWMEFDQGDPEEEEPKGGIFAVGEARAGVLELRFGDPGPDLARVRAGDVVWKSHDSALKRRLLRYVEAERRLPLDLVVRGAAGRPL